MVLVVTSHIPVSTFLRRREMRVSARRHPELRLQLLVHHVADADGGDDLEEVWRQAPVEARRALSLHDLLEEARHGNLRTALRRRCRDKTTFSSEAAIFRDERRHAVVIFLPLALAGVCVCASPCACMRVRTRASG